MLSSSNRLSTALFKDIIQKGSIFHGDFIMIRCLDSESDSRFGVSVPKKVMPTAVMRNKARRRVYSIIRSLRPRFVLNKKMVFIMKSGSDKVSFGVLKKDIEKIFVKCGVLK